MVRLATLDALYSLRPKAVCELMTSDDVQYAWYVAKMPVIFLCPIFCITVIVVNLLPIFAPHADQKVFAAVYVIAASSWAFLNFSLTITAIRHRLNPFAMTIIGIMPQALMGLLGLFVTLVLKMAL